MIGRVIGNYRIDALLGQGGMGAVYRGMDIMLERPVAIKALRSEVASQPQLVERFRQEARTLARLLHPNIATLYSLVRDGDDLYMVMEFCEGETFESILRRRGRLSPEEALPLFTQALDGLGHAHQHGIVHRDIKPANLMRLPDGSVKVMDFGIARLLGSSRMTQTRHTVGTAEYMAPEQIRSKDVDARTDVYALGVLLYEMLTGRVPFEHESFFEVMQAHLQETPDPPRQFEASIPDGLEDVILRALAKEPADRFDSVDTLQEALRALGIAHAPLATPKATVAAPPPPPSPDKGTAEVAPPTTPKRKPRRKKPDAAPTTPATKGDPAATVIADPTSTQPAPTVLAPPTDGPPPATVVAPAPTAISPPPTGIATSPAALATSQTPVWKRIPPRTAMMAGGGVLLLLLSLVLLWPSGDVVTLPDEDETESINDAEFTAGGGSTFDRPLPPPPTINPIGTTQGTIQRWLATGQALLDAGSLTTPADSNALLFAERILSASPGHAGAGDLIRNIAQRYVGLGDRARQRGNSRSARSMYQQAITVADRHPGLAGTAKSAAQRGIQALTQAAPNVAQNDAPGRQTQPERAQPERREAGPSTPATGTVRVLVRPFGDVYVNGQRKARGTNAPVLVDLTPGSHRVRVTHPSFGAQERTVTVRPGQTSEVFIEFATPAEVTIVSDPINAEILLDGRGTGRYTPATITIPPGRHTVEVRKDGYRSASRTVNITAGSSPDRVSLTLTPQN